jgi:hypothetical protein
MGSVRWEPHMAYSCSAPGEIQSYASFLPRLYSLRIFRREQRYLIHDSFFCGQGSGFLPATSNSTRVVFVCIASAKARPPVTPMLFHLRSSFRSALLRVSIDPIAEPPAGLKLLFLKSRSTRTAFDDKALHKAWIPDSNVPMPFHSRLSAVNACACLLPSGVPGSRIPAPSRSFAMETAPGETRVVRLRHSTCFRAQFS